MYLEDLCFNAQQAVEKALKAVILALGNRFRYVHIIGELLFLIRESGVRVPDEIAEAERLTDYAVATRCPGPYEAVDMEEYQSVIALARRVVAWAEAFVSHA